MKKFAAILFVLTLIAAGVVSGADVSREKRAEIERLLKLTGVEKALTDSMNSMLTNLQVRVEKDYPATPQDFWVKFKAKVSVHDLIEQMVPVYDRYYTLEDLKAANAFFDSPAGRKVVESGPMITRDCADVGSVWGQKISQQAVDEIAKARKK